MSLNSKPRRKKEGKKDMTSMGRKSVSMLKVLIAHVLLFPFGAGYYLTGQILKQLLLVVLFWAPIILIVSYPLQVNLVLVFYALLFVASTADLLIGVRKRNLEIEVDYTIDKEVVSSGSSLKSLNKDA